MIIDSHAHQILPVESQIHWMDEANVDLTILFTSTIHPELANSLTELDQEMAALYNILNGTTNPITERIHALDQLAGAVKSHPTRFIGFGSIPFGLTYKENLDWIEKYILANNFRGLGEMTPASGQVSGMEELFHAAQEVGRFPVWIHTFFPLNFADIKEIFQLAKRYPDVPTILGHMGGIHWLETLKAVQDYPNVYLDLSASFTTMSLTFAMKEYPEKCLFSSDAPYTAPFIARTVVEKITDDKNILNRVLGFNIEKLLGL